MFRQQTKKFVGVEFKQDEYQQVTLAKVNGQVCLVESGVVRNKVIDTVKRKWWAHWLNYWQGSTQITSAVSGSLMLTEQINVSSQLNEVELDHYVKSQLPRLFSAASGTPLSWDWYVHHSAQETNKPMKSVTVCATKKQYVKKVLKQANEFNVFLHVIEDSVAGLWRAFEYLMKTRQWLNTGAVCIHIEDDYIYVLALCNKQLIAFKRVAFDQLIKNNLLDIQQWLRLLASMNLNDKLVSDTAIIINAEPKIVAIICQQLTDTGNSRIISAVIELPDFVGSNNTIHKISNREFVAFGRALRGVYA